MSKRFYEGDKGTLVVEESGRLFPFTLHMKRRQRKAMGLDSWVEVFPGSMSGYGSLSWDELTEDGEQFVEVEHEAAQDQTNQA